MKEDDLFAAYSVGARAVEVKRGERDLFRGHGVNVPGAHTIEQRFGLDSAAEREEAEAIFWAKVRRTPEWVVGCWLWMGTRNLRGYGRHTYRGRQMAAHRLAWEFAVGPIPADLLIRHLACDNPPCVRPSHLALGTAADNARDRQTRIKSAREVEFEARRRDAIAHSLSTMEAEDVHRKAPVIHDQLPIPSVRRTG